MCQLFHGAVEVDLVEDLGQLQVAYWTRPRLAARLIADGTGVCFIYLHENRVFGFHKDVSLA